MPAGSSGRRVARTEQRLGLLEIALARGIEDESKTALPPGQRDASGFWFPAGYRDPLALFTPQQRSLQARQRALKSRSGSVAEKHSPVSSQDIALPLVLTDAPPDAATAQNRHRHTRELEPRSHRPPAAACVDSPGRSV